MSFDPDDVRYHLPQAQWYAQPWMPAAPPPKRKPSAWYRLRQMVGWIILVPSVIAFLISDLGLMIGIYRLIAGLGAEYFVVYVTLSVILGLIGSFGLWMTGMVSDDD